MPTITFENVRDVQPYYQYDPRVLLGVNAVRNESYAGKAATLKAILEAADLISHFIDDVPYWQNGGNPPAPVAIGPGLAPVIVAPVAPAPPQEVRVRLHTTRETISPYARVNGFCFGTISQICKANALHQPGVLPYRTVHIEMDAWYFENYPLGYCAGMLCHEFAVHPLGTWYLHGRGDDSLLQEAAYRAGGAHAGMQYPGAVNPHVTPSTAGQADHAFAAYPGTGRYECYIEAVVHVAISMQAKIGAALPGEVAVRNADITDLFKCYLMDVASIQSTNDHRGRGLADPTGLGNCYNAHRLRLSAMLADPDPLAVALHALIPGPITSVTVLKEFAYLASSMAWGFGPTWSKSWTGF